MRTLIQLPLAALLACAGTRVNLNAAPSSSSGIPPHVCDAPAWVTVEDSSLGSNVEIRNVHWCRVVPKVMIAPKYPVEAQKKGIEGVCKVRFFIDEEGKPYDIKIEQCPEVFHEAATKAAWKWRFTPFEEDGEAVKATFLLALRFTLK